MANFHVYFLLKLVILFLFFTGNNSEYKQWQPNTNWNNPNNWDAGKVPCSHQEVQLISLQPLLVALSGQMSLHSLSLPTNGELVMNKDAKLTFYSNQNEHTSQCPEGGNIKFTATSPKDWYNPVNWREVDGDGNPVKYQTNGLLHLNQIPCVKDQVKFKRESSFMVKSDKPITVASVVMKGKVYTQNKSFQDYLGTSRGKIEFTFTTSVKLSGETCSDSRGCFCDTLHVREEVCTFVKCEQTYCKKPLSPSGSCCKYCGTILKANPSSKFNFSKFKNQVYNLYEKFLQSRASQVVFSMSKTQDGLVQLVFADSGNGKKAQNFADNVLDYISGYSQLSFKEKLQSSSSDTSNAASEGGSSSYSVDLAVGIGVGLAVLVMIIIVAIIVLKRKRIQGNDGSQQISDYEKVELQEKSGSTEQLSINESCRNTQAQESSNVLYESTNVEQTFENPLYDSTTEQQERII